MLYIRYLLIAAIVPACSFSEVDQSYSFRKYEENGVTIAETTGGPKYSDELFQYERILVLKEDPSRPESYLFNPGRITMDTDGLIYVADRGNHRIAVFNRDGEYLRSFGRKGEGPGEFLSLTLLFHYEGTLNLYDYQNRRATLYRIDGTLIDVIPPWDIYRYTKEIYQTHDGARIHVVYTEDLREGGYSWNGYEAYVIGADDEEVARISTPLVADFFAVDSGSSSGSLRIEFAGNPVLQYYPKQGILVTTGDESALYWYDLTGRLYSITRLMIDPLPVTEEERRIIQQRFIEHNEMISERYPDIGRAEKNVFSIRDSKAFWDDAYVDDAGYVWLQVPEITAAMQESGGPMMYVLSPEGEYLGNTRWPVVGRVSSCEIARGLFLGCEVDQDTGKRTPTIFQIVPSVDGMKYP